MSASAPPPVSAARRQRALKALGATISLAALAGVIVWALRQEPPTLPDSPSQIAAQMKPAIVASCSGTLENDAIASSAKWTILRIGYFVRPA